MYMQPDVIECRPMSRLRLWLRFRDGAEGVADLSHLAGQGVFEKWNEPGFFERVSVDSDAGTVAWPGGIDVDPYVLYSKVTGKPVPGAHPSAKAAS